MGKLLVFAAFGCWLFGCLAFVGAPFAAVNESNQAGSQMALIAFRLLVLGSLLFLCERVDALVNK